MQNSESPDLIYVIVPQADGTLSLSLTSDWDGDLYVRTDCGDSATELVCTDALGDNADGTPPGRRHREHVVLRVRRRLRRNRTARSR